MRTGASTLTRLPWVPDRFEVHDHCPPRKQGAKDSGVSTHAQPTDGYISTTCSSDWINDGMLTCHCRSSSSLPHSSGSLIRSLLPSMTNSDNPIHLSAEAKADLNWWINHFTIHMCRPIQPPTASLTLQTDASTIGWGAYLSGNKSNNRRSMVRARSCSPHQLAGAESSISGSAVLCQARQLPHPVAHGQHSCHILHQPERGNPLSQVMSASVGPVELVHGSQHNIACGAFSRETQCHC